MFMFHDLSNFFFLLPTSFFLLHMPYALCPTSFFLLPSSYFLLSDISFFFPITFLQALHVCMMKFQTLFSFFLIPTFFHFSASFLHALCVCLVIFFTPRKGNTKMKDNVGNCLTDERNIGNVLKFTTKTTKIRMILSITFLLIFSKLGVCGWTFHRTAILIGTPSSWPPGGPLVYTALFCY